ncbi:MAG TPA: hypothetical protein VGM28_00450 [Candidatus Limnocylindrales bacterium]
MRLGLIEAHPLPAFERRVVIGPRGLDDGAALVAGRPEQFLEKRLGDAICVVLRVDDEEVDRADVTAGPNGWTEREDRAPDDDALRFRDDDARLREIDQLAHQVRHAERAVAAAHLHGTVAQGDDPIDVRDARHSDQVFHADGSNLAGFGDQGPRSGSTEAATEARDPLATADDEDVRDALQVRPTGIAFRSPVGNIRHRFGGHLRAARTRDPVIATRSCIAVHGSSPGEGG